MVGRVIRIYRYTIKLQADDVSWCLILLGNSKSNWTHCLLHGLFKNSCTPRDQIVVSSYLQRETGLHVKSRVNRTSTLYQGEYCSIRMHWRSEEKVLVIVVSFWNSAKIRDRRNLIGFQVSSWLIMSAHNMLIWKKDNKSDSRIRMEWEKII